MARLPNASTEVIALGPSDSPGLCKQRFSQALATGCSRVVIDLTEVTRIDAAMVSVLTSAFRLLSARAGRLVLVHPTGLLALRTSGLSRLFDIAPTRERALAKLGDDSSLKPQDRATAGQLVSR